MSSKGDGDISRRVPQDLDIERPDRVLVLRWPDWPAGAEADRSRYVQDWEPVVRAVEALAPSVQVLAAGALVLSSGGPSRYYGGDEALASRVRSEAEKAAGAKGCWVGVADGFFAAHLAAGGLEEDLWELEGSVRIIPAGKTKRWLGPLPLKLLGWGYEDLVDLLNRLGIRTFSELASLPGADVLARFGSQGKAAHRLARGLDDFLLQARTPPPDTSVSCEMDPPEVRMDAVSFAVKSLCDGLVSRLRSAGLALVAAAIEARSDRGDKSLRHWRHEEAFDAPALAERARWQIDGWLSRHQDKDNQAASGSPTPRGVEGLWEPSELGYTPGVVLVKITPEEVRPEIGHQLDLWGAPSSQDLRAARSIARVQAILGPEEVKTAGFGEGRGIDEQYQPVSWGAPRSRRSCRPWPGRLARPSPAFIHLPRLEAELLDDQGMPVCVDAAGLLDRSPAFVVFAGAAPRPVMGWAGPWPVEERWWSAGGRRRQARVQVVVAGGEAHLLSRESARWWLEATYA